MLQTDSAQNQIRKPSLIYNHSVGIFVTSHAVRSNPYLLFVS